MYYYEHFSAKYSTLQRCSFEGTTPLINYKGMVFVEHKIKL